jgi:hypothetical protein
LVGFGVGVGWPVTGQLPPPSTGCEPFFDCTPKLNDWIGPPS